jgi:hypothetical protein
VCKCGVSSLVPLPGSLSLRVMIPLHPQQAPCAGSDLAPEDTQQLVQQGGMVLLCGDDIKFSHKDTGILMTANVDALLAAVKRSC